MAEELKPCPFCQGTDIIGGEHEGACVYCKTCHARAVSPAAWQARTPPPPTEGAEIVRKLSQMSRVRGMWTDADREYAARAATHITAQEAELTRLRQRVAEAAALMEPLVCYHETGGHEGDGSAVHLDSIRQWLDTHQPNGDGAS